MTDTEINGGDKKEKAKKDKPCSFYLTARGCIKGDSCDFQHIAAGGSDTKKPVKNRICDFYMTPQGCVKGIHCDFLHPHPGAALFGADPTAFSQLTGFPSVSTGTNTTKNEKLCSFFMTPRGCVKGDECDFSHARPGASPSFPNPYLPSNSNPYAALGYGFDPTMLGLMNPALASLVGGKLKKPTKQKICDFHKTERGCVKGDSCDFIHTKDRVCDFFNTARGCRKGMLCDFQHPSKDSGEQVENPSSPGKTKSSRDTGKRYAPY